MAVVVQYLNPNSITLYTVLYTSCSILSFQESYINLVILNIQYLMSFWIGQLDMNMDINNASFYLIYTVLYLLMTN